MERSTPQRADTDSAGTTQHTVPREQTDETEGLFVRTIAAMERGDLLPALDEELSELVGAIKKVGKAGTLTLTIGIKPEGSGELVTTAAKVSVKAPKEARQPTLFFTTDGDGLSRHDPRQLPVFEAQ